MSFTIADPSTEGAVLASLLSRAKSRLRITFNDDDTDIRNLIREAIEDIQDVCWRQLINAVVTLKLDCWPAVFILPRPPLVSVSSIQYYDQNDSLTTWDSSNYEVDTTSEPGRIAPAESVTYPTVDNRLHPIIVTYTAGYGTTADDIPWRIQQHIFRYVWHRYRKEEFPKGFWDCIENLRAKDERVLANVR